MENHARIGWPLEHGAWSREAPSCCCQSSKADCVWWVLADAGNTEKLAKMLKISDMRGDVMGGFHNALYLGDLRERVRILEDAGEGII